MPFLAFHLDAVYFSSNVFRTVGFSFMSLRVAVFLFLSLIATSAHTQTCTELDGAYVIAQDGTEKYLGFFGSQYASGSIMNKFGTYGSEISQSSVRNTYGTYGGSYSSYSANNDFASSPPIIYKNARELYYLSTNSYNFPWVTLAEIDASCTFFSVSPAALPSPPSPPSSVSVQDGQSTESLEVVWSVGSGATSYNVYYSTSNSNYKYLGNTSQRYTSITGLEQGVTYYIAVVSVNASGESSTYSHDTGYLASDPTNFIVTPSAGSGGSISPSAAQTITEGGAVQFTLIPESGYYLTSVGGSCGGSISGNSYTTYAVTADCSVSATFEQTIPAAPTITNADYGDGEIYLSVLVDSNATRYDASCTGGGSTFYGTSYTGYITVSGLINGVPYTCTATATNTEGTSAISELSPVITPEESTQAQGLPIWLMYEATKS